MVRLDWLKKHKYSAETRGNNRFIRVTWDEAIDLFYRELERVQKQYGPWALHAGPTRCFPQLYRDDATRGGYAR